MPGAQGVIYDTALRGVHHQQEAPPRRPLRREHDRHRRHDGHSGKRRHARRRHLDDTMRLGRAPSVGHARQHLNLIGFALT
jgi:hypothetical protein